MRKARLLLINTNSPKKTINITSSLKDCLPGFPSYC